MKRAFSVATAGALVATIAAAVAAAPAPAPPAKKPAPAKTPAVSKFRQHQLEMMKVSAPGDEYFGRMKISYLGINNEFRDDAIRAGLFTADPAIISRVNFADEALHQWESRYPRDPQLARSYWLGFLVYRKIYTAPAQDKAWNYLNTVAQKFPSTFFGKTAKQYLATGFTEHYYANPEPCPSPSVTPTLMPGGRVQIATPSPSPSPSPSPTPTPVPPGQPKVEILPVSCYTPQPSPTPVLSPTPLPSGATPTPLPSGVTPSPLPSGVTPSPLPSGVTPSPLPSGATPTPAGSPTPEPIKTMVPAPSPTVSPTPHRH